MTRHFEIVTDEHRVQKREDITLPKRQTANSAGYDFYLPKNINLKPGESTLVVFDVKAKMQTDEILMLFMRSSMGIKKGLVLANTVGIIDSDYYSNEDNDGNIMAKITNTSRHHVFVEKGERIIQGIFTKYLICDDDNTTTTRTGGVGSTK